MSYKTGSLAAVLLLAALLWLLIPVASQGFWDFPPAPPAEEYGNILISRTSEKNGVKPAIFSHWLHRQKFTCRVCHFELEFNMKVNTTEITEKTNKAGLHCGAASCHDGKAAFGHDESHCKTCHTGSKSSGNEKFAAIASTLPKSASGNNINWSRALKQKLIEPVTFLSIQPATDMNFKSKLTLAAEWSNIPPAVFPHRTHIQWLDCNNCHPDIFNIKKKTTRHFEMTRILKGEFCGVCHLNVAFPISDCKPCHPGMHK